MEDFDSESYIEKVNEFVRKINYMDDGKSAERVVDFLLEKMNAK